MSFSSVQVIKVSEQCLDNPYGFNGAVVFGDETYGMTPGCISDMSYNQYRRGNGFIAGVIHADHWYNARASRQMLPVNVAVSAISPPMNTRNQLGGHHLDPPSTDGYGLQQFMDGEGTGLSFGIEMNNPRKRRRIWV